MQQGLTSGVSYLCAPTRPCSGEGYLKVLTDRTVFFFRDCWGDPSKRLFCVWHNTRQCLVPTPRASDVANFALADQDSVLGCGAGGRRHGARLQTQEGERCSGCDCSVLMGVRSDFLSKEQKIFGILLLFHLVMCYHL